MKVRAVGIVIAYALATGTTPRSIFGTTAPTAGVKEVVDSAVQPLMKKDNIPGMALGVVVGENVYVFNYGLTSRSTRKPVVDATLFEIGSVSKTLTATLASYAQVNGKLSLSDRTSKFFPSLKGSKFGDVSLLNLATHTPGGLPLQVPAEITNEDQLLAYFKQWQPEYAPGTFRTYSNLSIGFLGQITAKSMGQGFTSLMEHRLFPALGMTNTFIDIAVARTEDYAQGYTRDDKPIRMAPGMLSTEAYGVKATASDLARFLQANMKLLRLDGPVQSAIANTHIQYFKAGEMTQDLIWEQYEYPVALETLIGGNATGPRAVAAIVPPGSPREDAWINKTGSTNGFGAYLAFVPEKRLGIVILANKNYPVGDRVTIAYKIIEALGR